MSKWWNALTKGTKVVIGVLAGLVTLGICIGLFLGLNALRPAASTSVPATPPAANPAEAPADADDKPDCAAEPVNPVDGVKVDLTSGVFVIEEYDNGKNPPEHRFNVYDADSQGTFTVWASEQLGMRAWACTDGDVAFDIAMKSAVGYASEHPDHRVWGPDGKEVQVDP